MFLSCAVTSILAVPLAQAAWQIKMQLPAERIERSSSYMRYQFNGRLRGKSGEAAFILYSILQKHLFQKHLSWCIALINSCLGSGWNKLTPERLTKREQSKLHRRKFISSLKAN